MKNSKKLLFFILIIVLGFGLDIGTKLAAKAYLMGHPAMSFFNNIFQLQYAENTGAFLSLGANWSNNISFWVFSLIPLLFLAGMLVYAIMKMNRMSTLAFFSIALIFAGGAGNISERIFNHRLVTDFMIFGIGKVVRSGVLNFADLYITAGCIILFFTINSFQKEEKKSDSQEKTKPEEKGQL